MRNQDRAAQKQFGALFALLLMLVGLAIAVNRAERGLNVSTPAHPFDFQSAHSSDVHDGFAVLAQMDDGSGQQVQDVQEEKTRAAPEGGPNTEAISFPRTGTFRANDGIYSLPPDLMDGEMEYIRYLETKYGDVDKAMAIIGCKGQAPGAFHAVYRTGDFVRDAWCSHR